VTVTPVQPFKPLSVVEQLVAHLHGAITRGELGGSMPGIRRLAATLAVSSNSITAALERLAGEDLLKPQGHGRRSRIILPKDFARSAYRLTNAPTSSRPMCWKFATG
jgi:DNA-binding transcriptional regulator YhcF (GntR family)